MNAAIIVLKIEVLNNDLNHKRTSIYPRKCDKCSKVFNFSSGFCVHKKRCGRADKKQPLYPRNCIICNRCYASKSSFCSHKKRCFKYIDSNSTKDEEYMKNLHICIRCGIHYSDHHSLKNHAPYCIGELPDRNFQCTLKDCSKSFSSVRLLSKHLHTNHKVSCFKDLSFESFSSFQQWLKLESSSTYKFKKATGKKETKDGIHHYYHCQFFRPKHFVPCGLRKKVKGTLPQGSRCPASIYALEKEHITEVFYFMQHDHEVRIENYSF